MVIKIKKTKYSSLNLSVIPSSLHKERTHVLDLSVLCVLPFRNLDFLQSHGQLTTKMLVSGTESVKLCHCSILTQWGNNGFQLLVASYYRIKNSCS